MDFLVLSWEEIFVLTCTLAVMYDLVYLTNKTINQSINQE